MVGDPNEDTRSLATSLLLPLGVVRTAVTGDEVIRIATETPPRLVLLDLSMPDVDGPTVCAILRAEGAARHASILGITDDPARGAAALDTGCDALLRKPWSARGLVLRACSLMLRPPDTAPPVNGCVIPRGKAEPAEALLEQCPHCNSRDVMQFDSVSTARCWFVCTRCARAWAADAPFAGPHESRRDSLAHTATAMKQLQVTVRAFERGRASRRAVVGALALARKAGLRGDQVAFAAIALTTGEEATASAANSPRCSRCSGRLDLQPARRGAHYVCCECGTRFGIDATSGTLTFLP